MEERVAKARSVCQADVDARACELLKPAMQEYVARNHRYLKTFLQDAWEWVSQAWRSVRGRTGRVSPATTTARWVWDLRE